MYIDSQELFSSAQAVTSTGDTASTNVYDAGAAYDSGNGEPFYVVVQVGTAVTSAGSATVAGVVQTSTDNSTWTDYLAGPAIAKTSLTAGANVLRVRVGPGLNRYVRVVYRVATAALTAGTFTAFVTKDLQANTPYTSGFTVA